MAQDTKWSVHDNIWHFTVTDPQLHRKGFTVYKVTCKTFPIKSPETLTEITCWKRYNDFKTLYKALLALHKALHRRDQFPEFAKPKLFGRFDDTVIEERRQSAVELLNFVATQPHLYKSLVFKQFLEEGRTKSDPNKRGQVMTPRPSNLDILASAPKTDGNPPPDLVPTNVGRGNERVMKPDGASTPKGDFESSSLTTPGNGAQNNHSELAALEGTWNYPQVADNISLDSSTGDETVDTDEDSILATSLPDTDLAFFDPISHDSGAGNAEDTSGLTRSSSWLLAGLNMCAEMNSQGEEENNEALDDDDTAATPMGPQPSADGKEPVTNIPATEPGTSVTSSSTVDRHSTDPSSPAGSSRKGSSSSSAATPGKSIDLEEFDPIRRMSQGSDASKVECGKGDLDLSSEWQARSASFASEISTGSQGRLQSHEQKFSHDKVQPSSIQVPASGRSSRSQSVGSDKSADSEKTSSNKSTPNRTSRSLLKRLVTGSPGARKPRSVTEQSVSTMDLGGKEDYIYLAASQICMAQNSEANGEYEVAFAYYKSGVGILLQGVQGDTNKSRRDAVRRKTAQYLMKAEDLFNRHLATEMVDERRWGADSFLSPSLDLDPSFAFIRGSVRELRNFQVLGTIDKVVLVRDKATDETFVIKSIPKSAPDTGRTQTILPTSCPYMVSLHKFYETDDSVFILLQYASGGKLWTYIGEYLNSDRGNQANAGGDVDFMRARTESRNIYSGTKVELVSRNEKSRSNTVQGTVPSVESNIKDKAGGIPPSDSNASRNVQCSEEHGIMRFSTLKRDLSETSAINQLTENSSQNKDLQSDSTEKADKSNNSESHDLYNDSLISDDISPLPKKDPLSRRISNLSDDYASVSEMDSSVISPTTVVEEDQFQSLLQEHRSNLEGFSINSFESEDTHLHSSSFREKIDSIPEDSENENSSPKHLASRQVSADEVFNLTRKEARQVIAEERVRHASTDGVFSHDVSKFAATLNSDDIIRSSRELLSQVEKVLSETNDRTGENLSSESSGAAGDSSDGNSVVKQLSSTSNDSTEEPSIYDVNRSSEEDTSDRTSNANSDKNPDSPVSDKGGLHQPPDSFAVLDEDTKDVDDEPGRKDVIVTNLSDDSMSQSGTVTGGSKSGSESEGVKSQHHVPSSSSLFRQSTPHKLSISRMDSKDMTRSASFECDLKSPTRNRARTVSDLFERLDSTSVEQVRIPESSVRKWMAQLITAVSRLHSLGIVCRDLKPDNVLLGDGGQVYLTYFCHVGHGEQMLDWDAVENLYAAPEVGSINGSDKSCDWWSIGALLYELVVGRSLSECHPGGINSHTCLHVPAFVSDEARGLLEGLLRHNPNERLGSGMAGSEEIKAHPFFTGVDWHALEYS